MDFQELIEKINRNTAAQVEQNKTWRLELGLPEREPTELELLLQKWELELAKEAKQSPAPEELVLSQEPEEEELPLPEPRGEEPLLPEPRGEEAKSIPPPQPRPPPLETSPALLDAVSWPGLVGPLGGMPGPPSSCPSSQVTGLPGTVACLVPHSAEKHTSTTAPTSTPPKQSGADGYGPLPRARGHPAGMHGPPSTRPYAQVAALPGTTGCTVPSSAPPGT
ncbi:UNVERIFIED_CONTAM: hypothetical protein FKN15_053829 [Acipenser sinensis]